MKMSSAAHDFDGEVLMENRTLDKGQKRLIARVRTLSAASDRDDTPKLDRRVWLANSVLGHEYIGEEDCSFG